MTGSRMTFELPRDEHAPGVARAALGAFADALDGERYDATRLLVSELVTNAVKYGGEGAVRLQVAAADGRFRAEVIDEGTGFVPKEREVDQEGGWAYRSSSTSPIAGGPSRGPPTCGSSWTCRPARPGRSS